MPSIWYVGNSDDRTITSTDWTAKGLTGDTVTWNKFNGWSINQSAFDAEQITFLDTLDEFIVTASDGPRPGDVVTGAVSSYVSESRVMELISGTGAAGGTQLSLDGVDVSTLDIDTDPIGLADLPDVSFAGATAGQRVAVTQVGGDGKPSAFGLRDDRMDFLRGARFVATGDSLTAANNDSINASWADSWATHLALASSGAIRLVWNAAHGGWTSVQLQAAFDAEVLAQAPTLVGIMPGRNDVLDGAGYPAMTAAFVKDAVAKCRAAGIGVFLVGQPPQGTAALSAPAGLAGVASATGGTLAAATYRYQVTALNGVGETLPSAAASVVVASGTTNSIRVTWGHVEGATKYKLYRETAPGSGTYGLITTITSTGQGFPVKHFLDTGSIAAGAVPPGSNTTAVALGDITSTMAINNWLNRYCAANDVPLIDVYDLLADPATGMWKTGYTIDGTHPSTTRQKYIGQRVWATIKPLIKPLPAPSAKNNVDPRNLMSNGLLITGSANLPTNWASYGGDGNFTDTLGAKTGFAGKALTAALTASDTRLHDALSISTGFSVGDRIQVAFRLQTEGCEAGGANVQFYVRCTGPNVRKGGLVLSAVDVDPSVWVLEFVVPAATTAIYLQGPYIANGVGSASIGEVTFTNLTTGQIITP